MAELKRISVEEFVELAERHERAYKYAYIQAYCEACAGKNMGVLCGQCHGDGYAVITLPILLTQRMAPEDFEALRAAIIFGGEYG